jgi:hypothetical protein
VLKIALPLDPCSLTCYLCVIEGVIRLNAWINWSILQSKRKAPSMPCSALQRINLGVGQTTALMMIGWKCDLSYK